MAGPQSTSAISMDVTYSKMSIETSIDYDHANVTLVVNVWHNLEGDFQKLMLHIGDSRQVRGGGGIQVTNPNRARFITC